MKKKLKMFVCIMLVISSMLSLTLSAFAVNESEPNNVIGQAKRIYDDGNNYGYISSTSDVDWWVISFDIDGFANFYLGSIPQSCNYNMHIYKSNGTLIASSTEPHYYSELFRIRIYKNTDYYIKIVSASGTSSTDSYKLRCKVYALQPARIFTVDSNNVWVEPFYSHNFDNNPLNTRDDAQIIIPRLWSMGYTAIEYENNSANAAASVYFTSDIIVVSSHGVPGIIGYNNSVLYGSYNNPNSSTDRSIYSNAGDASELDLVIYSTCNSGVTSTYGNLVDVTLNKGAYACFGWTQSLNSAMCYFWFEYFFDALNTGETVQGAIDTSLRLIEEEIGEGYSEMIDDYYEGTSRLDRLIVGGY